MFFVKDLSGSVKEFVNLVDAENYFESVFNSTEVFEKNDDKEKILKSRTHKEVGVIEINNKCVYLKVPFYEPSDKPGIKISKIGETPEKLRNKMDVIDETWS